MIRKLVLGIALALAATAATAQTTVRQSGTITPGHATKWVSPGVIGDAGTAASGSLTSLGVTNNGGPGICLNSAPITSPYNQICFTVTTNGGVKVSSYIYNGATNAGITFDVNGTVQNFPVFVGSTTAGDFACFVNTSGTLQDCGFAPAQVTNHAVAIGSGAATGFRSAAPGTTGIPLVSAGASSDPAFSTALVVGGGTGLTSGTSGGIPYFSGSTAMTSSGVLAANQLVLGGGAGTTPATLGSLGTTTTVLHGNASGAPSFAAIVAADLPAGVPTNTLRIITTSDSVVNTDCGKTLLAGTGSSGYFTITLPSVSGFAATCTVIITNGDTGRAKLLSGFPGDLPVYLWPKQTVAVQIVNGAWATLINHGRWRLTASQTINCDPAGSDSTAVDGFATGAGAFATTPYAYAVVQKYWDLAGAYTVTCNLPSGTLAVTAGNTFIGPLTGGQFPNDAVAPYGAPFIVNGAGMASTNYTSSTASVDLFMVTANGAIQVQNLSINITGAASHGLTAGGSGFIAFQNIDFKAGNTTNGAHLNAAGNEANIQTIGPYTISGSINIHAVSENLSHIVLNQVVTITGTPNWTTAFVQADLKGFIDATGFTFSGAGATGKRCQVISQGTINTSGGSLNSFFPGNAIGTADAASFAWFQ